MVHIVMSSHDCCADEVHQDASGILVQIVLALLWILCNSLETWLSVLSRLHSFPCLDWQKWQLIFVQMIWKWICVRIVSSLMGMSPSFNLLVSWRAWTFLEASCGCYACVRYVECHDRHDMSWRASRRVSSAVDHLPRSFWPGLVVP